jgi:hypothetical protein
MPTVLREGGYRFHFYSHESNEPPHIHVERAENEAKYWLDPLCLAANDGFAAHELNKILLLVKAHCDSLENSYNSFHGIRADHRRKKGQR